MEGIETESPRPNFSGGDAVEAGDVPIAGSLMLSQLGVVAQRFGSPGSTFALAGAFPRFMLPL